MHREETGKNRLVGADAHGWRRSKKRENFSGMNVRNQINKIWKGVVSGSKNVNRTVHIIFLPLHSKINWIFTPNFLSWNPHSQKLSIINARLEETVGKRFNVFRPLVYLYEIFYARTAFRNTVGNKVAGQASSRQPPEASQCHHE